MVLIAKCVIYTDFFVILAVDFTVAVAAAAVAATGLVVVIICET